MDYEALKDQWTDVEERDGVRLSWNTFPSSRMVCFTPSLMSLPSPNCCTGSISLSCPYRGHVHSPEGENGLAIAPV
jgi:hypothetical protein